MLLAATMMTLATAPIAASADTIITFGQTSSSNTIVATGDTNGTTLGGTDVAVEITQIDAALVTPIDAFLDISATNISGAVVVGGLVGQHFAGTFSVNSAADNSGTNYLCGTFSDGALTAIGATGIAVFANTATFLSDVITTLDLPRSISLGLTNVQPPISLVACTDASCSDTGVTISGFAASIAGNASARGAGAWRARAARGRAARAGVGAGEAAR